jgi:hypothetical protein
LHDQVGLVAEFGEAFPGGADQAYVFGYRVGGHAEDPAGIAGRVF